MMGDPKPCRHGHKSRLNRVSLLLTGREEVFPAYTTIAMPSKECCHSRRRNIFARTAYISSSQNRCLSRHLAPKSQEFPRHPPHPGQLRTHDLLRRRHGRRPPYRFLSRRQQSLVRLPGSLPPTPLQLTHSYLCPAALDLSTGTPRYSPHPDPHYLPRRLLRPRHHRRSL